VVNPAFQVLLSVQIVLVLEWVVLLISTSKSAQPVTNEYLRNSALMPDLEDSTASSSSGGGCVYNPNAPARFDMGFILLMVLSAYYLIRRKRRFV
jgi:flagellar biogenesis protein FliO